MKQEERGEEEAKIKDGRVEINRDGWSTGERGTEEREEREGVKGNERN